MPMLKDGYMWTTRFQKVNPVSMLLEYFYPFGMKFWFAEKRPEEWKSEGFYERTFIHDTKKPILQSRDPNVKDLGCQLSLSKMNQFKKSQILYFRKKALLYRMSHFNNQLPDLDINVTGRDRELTLPFLQLFYGTDASEGCRMGYAIPAR